MKKNIHQLLFAVILLSCISIKAQQSSQPIMPGNMPKQNASNLPSGEMYKNANLTYSLTPQTNNTWGYNILVDNKLTIVQPTPPGMSGNEGFKTKSGAETIAKLVVKKMKNGEMPPTVSIEEMKQLKAIK